MGPDFDQSDDPYIAYRERSARGDTPPAATRHLHSAKSYSGPLTPV
jgi:hypothetical protein